MFWITFIGWIFFIVPVLAFFVFSVWMISEAKKDDDQIGAFIGLLFLLWVIGIVLLAVSYLSRYL
ncbi:MAG TPA: hypothetical protein VJB99_02265 [Patescibacteria group bacterium]|nr:hypothetical protein [Patescibacteria group bacterium]